MEVNRNSASSKPKNDCGMASIYLGRRGQRNLCINDTPLWLRYGDATTGLALRCRDLGVA